MVDKKQLELNTILEVTEAINNNLPEDSLYKIFYFICISDMKFKKMSLLVFEKEGVVEKVNHWLKIPEEFLKNAEEFDASKKIIYCRDTGRPEGFEEVNIAIPVTHKQKKLAILLLGGFEDDDEKAHHTEFYFVQTLANIMMVAIENKRLVRKEIRREAFRKELEIARHVQSLLFPKELPENEVMSMHASYIPHYSVGGDYYDVMRLSEDEILMCIADVSGKGVPAAILMSNFQASLRTLAHQTNDLTRIVHELNHTITTISEGGHFITFFGAIYNEKKRKLRYINAGHNAPFMVCDDKMILLKEGTTILGALDELPFVHQGEHDVKTDSLFYSYTDGVTETVNDADEEFGEERLESFVNENASILLKDMHALLLHTLDEFKESQPYSDDLTMLSCRFF